MELANGSTVSIQRFCLFEPSPDMTLYSLFRFNTTLVSVPVVVSYITFIVVACFNTTLVSVRALFIPSMVIGLARFNTTLVSVRENQYVNIL